MFCDTFVWFHNICLLLKKNKHWCIGIKHSNCFLRLFRLSIAYVLPKKACIKRLLLILDVIWQEFIANIDSLKWMVNLLFVWWFSMNGSLELNWAHAISTLSKHISINKRFIFCEHCELLEKLEYELCWFGIFFSQLQKFWWKKKFFFIKMCTELENYFVRFSMKYSKSFSVLLTTSWCDFIYFDKW